MMQSNKKNSLMMALFAIGLLSSLSLTSCLTTMWTNNMKSERNLAKYADVKFNGDTGLSKRLKLDGIYCNDLEFRFFLFYPNGVFDVIPLGEGCQYRFLNKSVLEIVGGSVNETFKWGYHSGLYKVIGDTITANTYYSYTAFRRWDCMTQYQFLIIDHEHILLLRHRICSTNGFYDWDEDNVELYFTPIEPIDMPSSESKLMRKKWLKGENFKKERK